MTHSSSFRIWEFLALSFRPRFPDFQISYFTLRMFSLVITYLTRAFVLKIFTWLGIEKCLFQTFIIWWTGSPIVMWEFSLVDGRSCEKWPVTWKPYFVFPGLTFLWTEPLHRRKLTSHLPILTRSFQRHNFRRHEQNKKSIKYSLKIPLVFTRPGVTHVFFSHDHSYEPVHW